MFRLFRFLVILGLVALFGCAHQVQQDRPEEFPNRANRFDIRFAWGTQPAGDAIEVRGIATNVRFDYVEDLQLQLSLLDAGGRVIAKDTFFFIPSQIPRDASAPFAITLKGAASPGEKLQFLYQYRVVEGNDTFTWNSRFIADAATGAVFHEE